MESDCEYYYVKMEMEMEDGDNELGIKVVGRFKAC